MQSPIPTIVVTCYACGQRIPLYSDSLEMRKHGMFEVGPDEPNIICPGSNTSQFKFDLDEAKLMGFEGEQHA